MTDKGSGVAGIAVVEVASPGRTATEVGVGLLPALVDAVVERCG